MRMDTPWAEQYRGSGRFTGSLRAAPVYDNRGDVAPGWVWVGDMTPDEFWAEVERQSIGRE